MNDFLKVNKNEYLPLRDVVFNTIRDAILEDLLKPGERLTEKNLSDRIGVSRTPIREALRKLELEGFVEILPRKGAVVSKISEKDVENVLEIREALEYLAVQLACIHMTDADIAQLKNAKDNFEDAYETIDSDLLAQKDEAFHKIILESTKNEKLVLIINNLREYIYRYRLTYLRDKSYRKKIVTEHQKIYEALEKRDIKASQKTITEHIENQKKQLLSHINLKRSH